jgi:hypothetical protein
LDRLRRLRAGSLLAAKPAPDGLAALTGLNRFLISRITAFMTAQFLETKQGSYFILDT